MNNGSAPMWKVLVYDSIGQSILAPIFSVKELRELGVTLHIALHSERDAVPDVPAVYFCLPSEENLQAHQMATYLRFINSNQQQAEEVPYQTGLSLFGMSFD